MIFVSGNGAQEGRLPAGTRNALSLRHIPGPVVERGFGIPVMAAQCLEKAVRLARHKPLDFEFLFCAGQQVDKQGGSGRPLTGSQPRRRSPSRASACGCPVLKAVVILQPRSIEDYKPLCGCKQISRWRGMPAKISLRALRFSIGKNDSISVNSSVSE